MPVFNDVRLVGGNLPEWIGFSEDDARSLAEGADSGQESCELSQRVKDNGFHFSLSLEDSARDSVIFGVAEGDKRRNHASFCGKSFGGP